MTTNEKRCKCPICQLARYDKARNANTAQRLVDKYFEGMIAEKYTENEIKRLRRMRHGLGR